MSTARASSTPAAVPPGLPTVPAVREIMTKRVVTISMDATLQEARRVFNDKRFHHLVVMNDEQPVGVISDRDLLKHLSPFIGSRFNQRPQDLETLKRKVHQFMTRELISIAPDAPAALAALKLIQHGVSCLPVVDDKKQLRGIITTKDLLRWFVRSQVATLRKRR